jgi:4-aminobutyrate aminotransferase
MFAWQHTGVRPDILALAKGLGSGLPIGLMVGARKIMERWPPGSHANTYGGNPICCAAALATLKLVNGQYTENARLMGERSMQRLRKFAQEFSVIGEVRGAGLMIGMEFVSDRTTKAPAKEFATRLVSRAFENGLLLLECGASGLRIIPPLMIEPKVLDEGLDILHRSFVEVLAERD